MKWVTPADATVVAKIWQGPHTTAGQRLWYGLQPETDLAGRFTSGLGPSGLGWTAAEHGVTAGVPFPISLSCTRIGCAEIPNGTEKSYLRTVRTLCPFGRRILRRTRH